MRYQLADSPRIQGVACSSLNRGSFVWLRQCIHCSDSVSFTAFDRTQHPLNTYLEGNSFAKEIPASRLSASSESGLSYSVWGQQFDGPLPACLQVGKNKRISKGKKGGKKKSVDPFSRKDWYDVKAPSMFTTRSVGKTLVTRTTGTKVCLLHQHWSCLYTSAFDQQTEQVANIYISFHADCF